jgi:hypothetical protein
MRETAMTIAPRDAFLNRIAVPAALATGLSLGVAITPAAADPTYAGHLAAPHITSVRVEGTDAYVTFTDFSSGEEYFNIVLRERDNPDRLVNYDNLPGSPGASREVARQLSGVAPGVAVCATVSGVRGNLTVETSPPSNTVCSDPTRAPLDLAMDNIRGKAEQQWTTVQSQAPAYLVAFRNAGSDASGITLNISTSGVAALGDQGAVSGGWSAAGFACATRPPSGGETAALSCTGGKLAKGQASNPAVIVKFTGPGQGTIHAQISGEGTDTNQGNNGTALGVRVL